ALLVHHVVVLEQMLAGLEVAPLHLLLGALDRLRHHPVLDGDALLHAEALHPRHQPLAAEDAHQIVLEGEVEARRAGIALAAGAAAERVIDAPRLVAPRAEDLPAAATADLLVL